MATLIRRRRCGDTRSLPSLEADEKSGAKEPICGAVSVRLSSGRNYYHLLPSFDLSFKKSIVHYGLKNEDGDNRGTLKILLDCISHHTLVNRR